MRVNVEEAVSDLKAHRQLVSRLACADGRMILELNPPEEIVEALRSEGDTLDFGRADEKMDVRAREAPAARYDAFVEDEDADSMLDGQKTKRTRAESRGGEFQTDDTRSSISALNPQKLRGFASPP